MRWPRAGVLGAGLLLASACDGGAAPGASRCLPEPLSAEPARAVVGRALTVSSPAASCDLGYPPGHTYDLRLDLEGRADPVDLGPVAVAGDGSFATTVTVPPDAPPGAASVSVTGSPYDEPCDDGERSCAGYSVRVVLLAAS